MRKNNFLRSITTIIIMLITTAIFAQNAENTSWKQFRGNNLDGQSLETDLSNQWPGNGLEQLWKIQLGEGFSEVLVEADVCYTMHSIQIDSTSGTENIAAFDANTGKKIWDTKVDSIFIDPDGWGNGPRSTPAMDEQSLYCFSSFGKLVAVSKKDGKIIWTKDFVAEYGSQFPRWGFSSSPIIVDGMLVIETGGKDKKAFTAFNKETGDVIWTKGEGESSYCSPTVATIDGVKQIVFANGNTLYSFNTAGDTLWTFTMPLGNPTAVPLFIAPNKFFESYISRVGGFIVEINDGKPSQIAAATDLKNHWSSSVYFEDHIYGFDNATLKCVSTDSLSTKWVKRGLGKGSLILADKKLYVLSDKGKLVMVDTKADVYTQLAEFQAIEGKSWTAPSIANGRIYVRNLTEMACYKLK